MTTIAYCEGIIAYDSRQTNADTISDDDADKMTIRGGDRFFFYGQPADYDNFISGFNDDHSDKKVINAGGFYIKAGGSELFMIGYNEDGFWKQSIDLNKPYAIGSGSDHAWTAMDLGCTAKEAVKMAMKRDTGTGGRIRTYKLRVE